MFEIFIKTYCSFLVAVSFACTAVWWLHHCYYGNAQSLCSLHEPVSIILFMYFDRMLPIGYCVYKFYEQFSLIFTNFGTDFKFIFFFNFNALPGESFNIKRKYFCSIIFIYILNLKKNDKKWNKYFFIHSSLRICTFIYMHCCRFYSFLWL